MPLPTDERVVETSTNLLETFHQIFGPHPGYRPAHAKGILLRGKFVPNEVAKSLTTAPHFNRAFTPVLARLSSSTGIPELPDTDPNGNPRGLAIRFNLAESPRRVHTDIVAHSVDGFPGTTGEEALEFFKAIRDGTIGDYLSSHPKAQEFVQIPKPTPVSFGRQSYFAVNAFKFIGPDAKETFVRYRIVPVQGEEFLDEAQLKQKSSGFLFDELKDDLANKPIEFILTAQVAEEGDVTDDNTKKWPKERRLVELGTITLTDVVDDQHAQQKRIIFDPIPRVEGIEPSNDPLLQVRAGLYLMSGQERREAS